MEVSRRDFIKITGASAAGAVLFNGCQVPEREMVLESPVRIPEDTINSFENWYASVCRQCGAGCGILVRVVEGRAKKIEGNPDHPLNQGKLCARGEAGLQALYHPDRIRTPLRRSGPRGSGQYQVITWDEAIAELVSRLDDQAKQSSADTVVIATEPTHGLSAHILNTFARNYGATLMAHEPLEHTALYAAFKNLFGQERAPHFDIQRAASVLSFGANFLEPWLSQVNYSRQYGEFRQGGRSRGHLVQVEPRLSMTAANADDWVPINPGTDGVLAMAIAHVLITERLADATAVQAMTGGAGADALAAFRPEEAEKITGVKVDKIKELARGLAAKSPSLVIGGSGPAGHTNGLFNITAIYALNFLLGNIGKSGGVQFNPAPPTPELAANLPATPMRTWGQLASRIQNKQPKPVNLLLVHNANPLYSLPPTLGFGNGLKNIAVIVSFSSFMDETTAMADLILPDHSYLESWGEDSPDPGVGYQAVGLQQPTVEPSYSTRSFMDVILALAKGLGEKTRSGLPWDDYKGALEDIGKKLFALNRGSVRAPDFASFWHGALQRGGWWDTQSSPTLPNPRPPALSRQMSLPGFEGSDTEYPFYLHVYASNSLYDGRGAHLPWLQMTPDPMTTVSWQTWVEINPKTASQMGFKEGDIVIVESPAGKLEVPVYVYPAIPPNVVAIPTGQGHSSMGRYGERRGANPFLILSSKTEESTGAMAWGATRVRISKTGKSYRLPKLEGSVLAVEPDDYKVVEITR